MDQAKKSLDIHCQDKVQKANIIKKVQSIYPLSLMNVGQLINLQKTKINFLSMKIQKRQCLYIDHNSRRVMNIFQKLECKNLTNLNVLQIKIFLFQQLKIIRENNKTVTIRKGWKHQKIKLQTKLNGNRSIQVPQLNIFLKKTNNNTIYHTIQLNIFSNVSSTTFVPQKKQKNGNSQLIKRTKRKMKKKKDIISSKNKIKAISRIIVHLKINHKNQINHYQNKNNHQFQIKMISKRKKKIKIRTTITIRNNVFVLLYSKGWGRIDQINYKQQFLIKQIINSSPNKLINQNIIFIRRQRLRFQAVQSFTMVSIFSLLFVFQQSRNIQKSYQSNHNSIANNVTKQVTKQLKIRKVYSIETVKIIFIFVLSYIYQMKRVSHPIEASGVSEADEGSPQQNNSISKPKVSKPLIPSIDDKLNAFNRLMPRKLTQDKQFLYSQNIKLKQIIRELSDQNTRLKTRLSISQNEKEQLMIEVEKHAKSSTQFKPLVNSKAAYKQSALNLHNNAKNHLNKRIFRDNKEEIEQLKNQNNRIKKSIKYTQVSQLLVQNQILHKQMQHLNAYIYDLNNNNNQFEEYQRAIEELKDKIQSQKQQNKSFPIQLKKKNEEIEQLKEKIRNTQSTKNQVIKRLNKEIEVLKMDIKRLTKNNLKEIMQKPIEKLPEKSIEKTTHPKSGNFNKKVISNKRILEKQKGNSKSNHANKVINVKQNEIEKAKSKVKVKVKVKEEQKPKQKEIIQEQSSPNYQSDDDNYEQKFQQQKQVAVSPVGKSKNLEDNYEEEFQQQGNQQFLKRSSKLNQKQQSSSGQEEQLFGSQEKQQKNIPSINAEEKTILKESLTYKFMAQRYTYKQLCQDINNSGAISFTIQEMQTMLGNQPFFLSPFQAQQVVHDCIKQAKKKSINQKISAKQLTKSLRQYIGEYEPLSEQSEQQIMLKLVKNIQENEQGIRKRLKTLSFEYEAAQMEKMMVVSKKSFSDTLKFYKLSDVQIKIAIGQICIISYDIEHLNYLQFLKRMLESPEESRQ